MLSAGHRDEHPLLQQEELAAERRSCKSRPACWTRFLGYPHPNSSVADPQQHPPGSHR